MYSFSDYLNRLNWRYAIKFYLLAKLQNWISPESRFFNAQMAEDAVLNVLCNIKNKRDGFYIDVGCNKPVRFSNSFYFYLRNWQGLCIDGNEELTREFQRVRKKDNVVHALVSNEEKKVNFHLSKDHHEISTMDSDAKAKLSQQWQYDYSLEMQTIRLDKLLQQQGISPGDAIDFLSIDVEGHDFEVLQSIDLRQYRPRFIVIETHDTLLTEQISDYLIPFDYEKVCSIGWNSYYRSLR